MDPFKRLGLARDADAIQVKRAYARLLRTHLPDEDPEGFQRLHEAYRACLQQVHWRQQVDAEPAEDEAALEIAMQREDIPVEDTPVEGTPDEARGGAPAAPVMHDAFDAGAFAADLVARMQSGSAHEVQAWLDAHEALYSLERKHGLQPLVVHALAGVQADDAARHFDVVTRFFGLDTVGVDVWLRRELDALLARIGDASRFDLQLRRHTSRHSDWTERQLAREALGPRNWLRRLLLVVFPGLASRVGTLVRSLRMADPAQAALRLDAAACRFWESVTDRSRLSRERLAFIAIRIGLWSLLLAGGAATNPAGRFMHDWGLSALALSLPWLAYALALVGFAQFRRYNQMSLGWDMPTVLACTGTLASAILLQFAPIGGIVGFAVTGLVWLAARGDKTREANLGSWATIATAAAALLFAGSAISTLSGDAIRMRHGFTLAAIYTMAVLVLHDVAYAHRRRIPLQVAHTQPGWLWWVFGAQVLLMLLLAWWSIP